MESQSYPQCRIIPLQMLRADNAEKFLDGLSYIPGIRRMLVHGPGFSSENPKDHFKDKKTPLPVLSDVKISDQNVQMRVMMGDVIVEAADESVIEKVADFCIEFLQDMPVQILVGKFIKTEASLSDYLEKIPESDNDLIGLSDYKQRIDPVIINQDSQCNA
ncbi:MAG: methyl-coenzyme M reductase operon protein D [Methanospirillum sp.]|uniref:methyl-coenzyme M reductase operon protein D n=1 Tax=Methanospirillum sp. TaxID=45200 RepID=UPI00237592AD|nr:methyl-coenzyme M reductase operon protein D [Methanospirillum sp.]MDD1727533.1 methyl-coenzyme M reductase operon protein D [Methanospirillum sp.]